MEISEITALIMSLAPTISAVIGIIVSLVAGIKRIKQANKDVIEEVKANNEAAKEEWLKSNHEIIEANLKLACENYNLHQENEELKRDLRKVMAKLNHVKIKDE